MMNEYNGRKLRRLVLNFSGHPVLPGQEEAIIRLTNWQAMEVLNVQFGNVPEDENFVVSIINSVERIGLTPEEWQAIPIVVIPAGYSVIWSVVLAELHGRLGYFPDVVRLRPAPSGSPEKFEVAEIMNLGEIRHSSRRRR